MTEISAQIIISTKKFKNKNPLKINCWCQIEFKTKKENKVL